MTSAPRFAIVTVNFASSQLIKQNAGKLVLPPDGKLYLVDCFSSAAEQQALRDVAAQLGAECLLLDENRGYGGGTNAGADQAIADGAEVVIALNPDARIDPATVSALVRGAHDRDVLISPRILTSEGRTWFAGAGLYLDDGSTGGTSAAVGRSGRNCRPWATGACFAMSAGLWSKVGGFDEEYFLYWEDIDLSHRVLDLGGSLESIDAVVIHDEGGTHTDLKAPRAKSSTYYYYNIRNRLLYARKHLGPAAQRQWVRRTPGVAYRVLLQGGRRQLVTSTAPWRAYLRGMWAGWRLLRSPRPARSSG